MPVAEAWVDPQRDSASRHPLAVLIDHLRRAAVHVDVVLLDDVECLAVEDVGCVYDLGRMVLLARLVAGGNRAMNLASANAIDQHTVAAHQIQDR